MKHTKKSAMTLLLATVLLLSGCAEKEPAPAPGTDMTTSKESSSSDPESSGNISSEPERMDSPQSTASSDSSSYSSEEILFWNTQKYLDLKGEELITKFGWPYDASIDIEGMTAQKVTVGVEGHDVFEDIPLSEISNKFRWHVTCDYGCLAMTPENGSEYEYKKYKKGDKIGDFTVSKIETLFRNVEYLSDDMIYFNGLKADFNGEITLIGELSIPQWSEYPSNGLVFYPDEESRQKLPVVNFEPNLAPLDYTVETPYPPKVENLQLSLGETTDYPEIDFGKIPTDGTRVKVKIKIKDYSYRALVVTGLPFIGSAHIVDGIFEIL